MNLTISTRISTWKQIKGQYIAAACGLALALSAVVASTPWSNGSTTPKALDPTSSFSSYKEEQTPSFVYYLVESQGEAALFDSVLSSESGAFGSMAVQTITLVVDTPEAESLIAEATRELMQFGVNYRVVDLRTQLTLPGSPTLDESSVSQPNSQLDADIMASVISTEQATWAQGGAD
jgi:hypothetical protein